MLTGQEIGLSDSLIIAVTGMAIVMLELGLLALFVSILSKVLAPFSKKKEASSAAAATAPIPEPQIIDCGLDDDELAAVMTAVCQETGRSPEQILIKSIEVKNM